MLCVCMSGTCLEGGLPPGQPRRRTPHHTPDQRHVASGCSTVPFGLQGSCVHEHGGLICTPRQCACGGTHKGALLQPRASCPKLPVAPGLELESLPCQPAVRLYIHSPSPRSTPEPGAPHHAQGLPAMENGATLPSLESLSDDVLPDVFSMLPHYADLSTFMIQQVIKFAKAIPAFRSA